MSALSANAVLSDVSLPMVPRLCTIEFDGEMTCVGPVAVSPPDAYKIGGDTKRLPRVSRDLGSQRYIPAGTLRHAIRHNIAAVVFTALNARGITLPLAAILAMDKGFIDMRASDKPKSKGRQGVAAAGKAVAKAKAASVASTSEASASVAAPEKEKGLKPSAALMLEREVREKNPILSMLGSWTLPAELRVGNAIPRAVGEPGYLGLSPGLVRMPLGDDTQSFLATDDMSGYVAMLDKQNDESKTNHGADGDSDSGTASGTKKDVGLRYYDTNGYEYINAGTICDWKISLHRGDDDLRLGALLAGLRAWSNNTVIGAHKALGFGEVAATFKVRAKVASLLRAPSSAEIGEVAITNGSFVLVGERLERALATFDAAAEDGFLGAGLDFTVIPRVSDPVKGKDADGSSEAGSSADTDADAGAEDAE